MARTVSGEVTERGRRWHTVRTGAILFLLLIVGYALDNFFIHPGSRDRQAQIVNELKAMPLPPSSTDGEFESGFQPSKGRASKQFISGQTDRQIGDFYNQLMNEKGWQRLQQRSPELVAFQKGNVIFTVIYIRGDLSGRHYALVLSWPAFR